ncbi:MAG: GTPase HflX [Acidobacteria bacterium]|nr:GTPase HflX [Acidobacteriota bacterium]
MLVGLNLPNHPPGLVEEHLDELAELAASAGVEVAARAVQSRKTPHARTFIGPGKAEEIGVAAASLEADLVIFDDDLSASQVRKLEDIVDRQVLDRSALILEIFQQRARTREALTQVELARLEYLLPRLTRRWTHLSRQVGGIGVRGGEGETQLEADRRLLRRQIQRLEKDLAKIERTRRLQSRRRRHANTVALAGYTNAGKSTLFNRLTKAGVKAGSHLFATLDAKLRRAVLGDGRPVVFGDTVGFIRKLPHGLVASFRSTLAGIQDADVVLHVVDRSHARWREHLEVGREVLAGLGVDDERTLVVYNKMDRLPEGYRANDGITISATTGDGLEKLDEALRIRFDAANGAFRHPQRQRCGPALAPAQGAKDPGDGGVS